MRNSSIECVTSALVVILLLACGFFHLNTSAPVPKPRQAPFLCIGVFHPQIGTGLVFPSPGDDVLKLAQENLGIPGLCTRFSKTPEFQSPVFLVFDEVQGECRLKRIGPLPQALRLLCGEKIDLNRAEEEDLVLLPGIGEQRARQIVEQRKATGPFSSPRDLLKIPGIGPKTIERLEDWLEW